MKIGDLVKRNGMSSDKQTIADNKALGIGIVVGLGPRAEAGLHKSTDPDFIVMWPEYGVGYEMLCRLEVVNESR